MQFYSALFRATYWLYGYFIIELDFPVQKNANFLIPAGEGSIRFNHALF